MSSLAKDVSDANEFIDQINYLTPKPNRLLKVKRKRSLSGSRESVELEEKSSLKKLVKRSPGTAFVSSVAASPFIIPPSPLMKKLGHGTGVTVYRFNRISSKGQIRSPWAIKKAKKATGTQAWWSDVPAKRLQAESEILKQLKHPNIIAFRNFTKLDSGDTVLSMEECGFSLDSLIDTKREYELMFSAICVTKVAVGIARALEYLHDTVKLLHADVKSGNILVSVGFKKVKLCDFGVSVFLKDDLSDLRDPSASYIGSEPWRCKEVLDDEGPITNKADIFPYGLVIWEMLSLKTPHLDLMPGGDGSFISTGDTDGSFLSTDGSDDDDDPEEYLNALGTRPPLPDIEYHEDFQPVIEVFVCCTEEDFQKRPDAKQILVALEAPAKELEAWE